LTNVVKHAGATRAVVDLCYSSNHLTIVVRDDGSGRSADVLATVGGGHGLVGMRERAVVFGGTLHAGPTPSGGWEVRARLPIAAVPEPR
jgi:signal transduction histidine kinase